MIKQFHSRDTKVQQEKETDKPDRTCKDYDTIRKLVKGKDAGVKSIKPYLRYSL